MAHDEPSGEAARDFRDTQKTPEPGFALHAAPDPEPVIYDKNNCPYFGRKKAPIEAWSHGVSGK